jgi:hypothetical protein
VLFTYTIPVVDMDELDDLWNKPMHIAQAALAPILLATVLPGLLPLAVEFCGG